VKNKTASAWDDTLVTEFNYASSICALLELWHTLAPSPTLWTKDMAYNSFLYDA